MSKRDTLGNSNEFNTDNNQTKSIYAHNSEKRQIEQKRRRVTRACDNCRQKKVKCDGKQPCIHCTVYSYNCAYDQPNIRNKKNSGIPIPSGNSSIINSYKVPFSQSKEISTTSPVNSNLVLGQNILNLLFPKLKLNLLDEKQIHFDYEKFQKVYQYVQYKGNGQVNLNEVMDLYLDGPTPSSSPSTLDRQPSVSSVEENSDGREFKLMLPSKDTALQLIFTCWNKACVLFRFYHRPSLLKEVELLYGLDPVNFTDRQQKFLPFLYSILAVGLLFSRLFNESSPNNNTLEDDGFKYFLEARKLIDITDVGDIISIQTIVMMIMYLQCSARLSTCYSYIGIALRSAIKEGLHRNLSIFQNSKRELDPIEVDTRKRLFYTIYKMDIYINSLLGLPRSLSEDEFDQELPEELDDENITHEMYNYDKQQGKLSSSGCANHHTKVMMILSHIVRDLYPIKIKKQSSDNNPSPNHIHSKVTNLEQELKVWLDQLPKELRPTDPHDVDSGKGIPDRFILANFYLHLAFLNCQIMLYRPFIHFISNGTHYQAADPRSLIRGRNCIKVARMVVKLANKMIDKNLLVGTYWFSMYTIFFSIACLIYYFHYAHDNNLNQSGVNYAGILFDDDLNIDMIKHDIEIGRKVLDCLKNNSNSSMRIYNILNNLFEQLNRRTAMKGKNDSVSVQPPSIVDSTNQEPPNVSLNFDSINNFASMNNFEYPLSNKIKEESISSDFRTASQQKKQQQAAKQATSQPPVDSKKSIDLLFNNDYTDTYDIQSQTSAIPTAYLDQSNPIQNFASNTPSTSQRSSNQQSGEYLPGVIDQLDAQIFGRILPPYMLEKNAKQVNTNTSNNDFNLENVDNFEPQMNVDNFDFSILGNSNLMDYLDPFNHMN
ncbi:uncharacterized protein AC631_02683 [Debaryomyces fabryi]|uniref:Zn(2)-C6 fungal-type domain-containing protein n=1 Tax=Debaryomyces fabryi TaxID=58627 RepID=A0A0V1PZE7_9ASCO|nr:uncharacterized protein AC631_02683 [Debaryomyces fabryi]KSA01538.1 hypothetical protein AC631_02683 [Debaryomyces fabryi]CUM51665.1 unnamed protein product [Debaryomyces fabryi]